MFSLPKGNPNANEGIPLGKDDMTLLKGQMVGSQ